VQASDARSCQSHAVIFMDEKGCSQKTVYTLYKSFMEKWKELNSSKMFKKSVLKESLTMNVLPMRGMTFIPITKETVS
jgi:hypothetical protein